MRGAQARGTWQHRRRVSDTIGHAAFAIDRSGPRFYTRRGEPVAQVVEHPTFNQVVVGSSPTGLTKKKQ